MDQNLKICHLRRKRCDEHSRFFQRGISSWVSGILRSCLDKKKYLNISCCLCHECVKHFIEQQNVCFVVVVVFYWTKTLCPNWADKSVLARKYRSVSHTLYDSVKTNYWLSHFPPSAFQSLMSCHCFFYFWKK